MRHYGIQPRGRREDKKLISQLIISIVGIISLLFLFLYVGVPALLRLSSIIAGFKKESITNESNPELILEPFLDPLPLATNSAKLIVNGSSNPGYNVILYLNGVELEEKLVGNDGYFKFNNINLKEGDNEIYTVAKKDDQKSSPSQTVNVNFKKNAPKLEIENPKDGDSFRRDEREISIKGLTDEGNSLTLNDRFIYVSPDGSFSSNFRLNDGENKLEFKAIDRAGNETKTTLTVNYQS